VKNHQQQEQPSTPSVTKISEAAEQAAALMNNEVD
jgi:hypothetical protein